VFERGARTLEQCILNGATHMRTHVEVDPGVGMRGFEGVLALVEAYRWAIDIELCVFPQEGLTNNPGTDELLVEALRRGARVIGAAPGFDTDHRGQIARVFELARQFDVDVDMHLDSGDTAEDLDVPYVCELTERYGWGGRVAVGHETKIAALDPQALARMARRLADAGVAVTVLPATDLFMRGRGVPYNGIRGVTPAHLLLREGVNCSLSTNNVLNPFTPYGDGSLIRMANLYANVCQASAPDDLRECFAMLTTRSARLLRLEDYGIAEGRPADLVVLDCPDAAAAVAELATPLYGFKRGRQTFTRQPAVLHRP
jgi:cytosine/creatinine deaminase